MGDPPVSAFFPEALVPRAVRDGFLAAYGEGPETPSSLVAELGLPDLMDLVGNLSSSTGIILNPGEKARLKRGLRSAVEFHFPPAAAVAAPAGGAQGGVSEVRVQSSEGSGSIPLPGGGASGGPLTIVLDKPHRHALRFDRYLAQGLPGTFEVLQVDKLAELRLHLEETQDCPPIEAERPTDEQLSAVAVQFAQTLLGHWPTPFVDFGIWGPLRGEGVGAA